VGVLVQAAVTAVRAATGATPALNGFNGPGQLADAYTVNESVALAELQRAVATSAHVARLLLR
jgi:hypothetical protein